MNRSVTHPRHRTRSRRLGRSPLLTVAVPIAVALAPVVSACGTAAAAPLFQPDSCVHAYHDPDKNEDTADPVGCGDPSANYRVLKNLNGDAPATVCDGTPGLTATYSVSYQRPYSSSFDGYTLCLGQL